jgi:hypothetical protein
MCIGDTGKVPSPIAFQIGIKTPETRKNKSKQVPALKATIQSENIKNPAYALYCSNYIRTHVYSN